MGWSDPVFGSLWLPKRIVGSLQPRIQGSALFAKCFARGMSSSQTHCVQPVAMKGDQF